MSAATLLRECVEEGRDVREQELVRSPLELGGRTDDVDGRGPVGIHVDVDVAPHDREPLLDLPHDLRRHDRFGDAGERRQEQELEGVHRVTGLEDQLDAVQRVAGLLEVRDGARERAVAHAVLAEHSKAGIGAQVPGSVVPFVAEGLEPLRERLLGVTCDDRTLDILGPHVHRDSQTSEMVCEVDTDAHLHEHAGERVDDVGGGLGADDVGGELGLGHGASLRRCGRNGPWCRKPTQERGIIPSFCDV